MDIVNLYKFLAWRLSGNTVIYDKPQDMDEGSRIIGNRGVTSFRDFLPSKESPVLTYLFPSAYSNHKI